MGKAEKPEERESMVGEMKQGVCLALYVYAHMYVAPSVGMHTGDDPQCLHVGRTE